MYKKSTARQTGLKVNQSAEGETLEQKIERIVNNKEPVKDGAPLIYTERSEGVNAAHNIKTDRWEIAVEAMDKVAQSKAAKREERGKANMKIVSDESTQGNDANNSSTESTGGTAETK